MEVVIDEDGLVLGRGSDAAIQLPYARVSARHARLFRVAGGYRVEDLGSTNGTRLGRRNLLPHVPEAIGLGESFEVAGIQVRLDGESPGAGTGLSALGTQTLARRLVHDLFEVGPSAEPPRLVVLSGPDQGRELVLSTGGRPSRIGRGESCDLVLSDQDVSREHGVVESGPAGFTVRDLGSKNGVEVSGTELRGERVLRDGDIVRFGETRLRFSDPEDRYLHQMEVAEAVEPAAAGALTSAVMAKTLPSSKLPVIAAATAVIILVAAIGCVLALAFLVHL